MKKRVAVLLALSAVGLLAFGAQGADTLEQIKQKGALTVGVKFRVPPFGFTDPVTGDLIGYDVDFANAIAAKLGVKLELRPVDQKNRIPELLEGNVDVIAANLVAYRDTDKVIDFSDVYLITGQGFLAKKGAVQGLGDLGGKKIGVMAGSPSEAGARMSLPSATIVAFDDYKKALQELKAGTIYAASGDASLLPALLPQLPQGEYEVPPVLIAEIPYVMGVRQGDQKLLEVVNQTIRELKQSGDAKKIHDKWFKPRPPAEQPAAKVAAKPVAQPADAPVADAAGAIVRKAAAPPGVVVVILRGIFKRDAEVSIFTAGGDFVCKGKVTSVFDDQVYVDADPDSYDSIKPGFAVGVNVKMDAAKAAILKHQNVLKSVQEQSKKDADAYVAQREKEGLAKEARQMEQDQQLYQMRLQVEQSRAENDEYYNVNVNRSWR